MRCTVNAMVMKLHTQIHTYACIWKRTFPASERVIVMLDHAQQVCKALRNAAKVYCLKWLVCRALLRAYMMRFRYAVLNEADKQKDVLRKGFEKPEMGGEGA